MRGLVSLKVRFLSKRLLANRAGEGTDILVHPHVYCQVIGFGKYFPADLKNITLNVTLRYSTVSFFNIVVFYWAWFLSTISTPVVYILH